MTRKDSFTVQQLIQLPQFGRLVQGFEQTAGLKMFVYDAAGNALGDEVTLPRFCQILRDAGSCPLLQDPGYHETTVPEIRQTCAGQGHVVVPVIDGRGQQVLNLVSSSARFGAPDMEALTRISFDQKVFPDDMVSAVRACAHSAEAIESHDNPGLAAGCNIWRKHLARSPMSTTERRFDQSYERRITTSSNRESARCDAWNSTTRSGRSDK